MRGTASQRAQGRGGLNKNTHRPHSRIRQVREEQEISAASVTRCPHGAGAVRHPPPRPMQPLRESSNKKNKNN